VLVIYPAFYSLHLATLNKSMQRFVGLGNFESCQARNFLAGRQAVMHFAISGLSSNGADWIHRRPFRSQHFPPKGSANGGGSAGAGVIRRR